MRALDLGIYALSGCAAVVLRCCGKRVPRYYGDRGELAFK
jgi:hypothetical protein